MCNTKYISIGPNQPHSREVKDSSTSSKKPFEVPYDFISSQLTRGYPPKIPTQPTLDPSYTYLYDLPHQDSSSNEELRGISLEEPLYLIPKTEVNQLRRHTRAYLKSLGQIPIIYQIPRYQVSQRRTQPYGHDDTFTSSIDDLIIDTIFEIRQPITDIAHYETSKDPEFRNLVDFHEEDLTFFDFPETQAGASGPPKTNSPLDSIPSP